jgi:DNA invertase Pin-like site-specific DNA recombinase
MAARRIDEDEDQERHNPRDSRRRLGLSYKRFSDPKQSKGDSEDRQNRDFRSFCRRHNLTPLTDDYTDRGLSGYKDSHRKKGRLGQLIAAVKDEVIERGTVIVVEAWDRLGRLKPNKQIDLLEELLENGVDIGVCRLDDIFTEADFGTHKWTTLAVFVQLAYQESKQKSDRISALWEKRREQARKSGQFMAGELPAWLEKVNGVIVPIPERVATVKRIFQLAVEGYGRARIIRTLDAENKKDKKKHQPFGSSGKWSIPYVSKILQDERVLGTFQPRHADDKPDGPAILNYYPPVISDDEWNLARAGQMARKKNSGPRDRKYVNVFQSLLTSALDGEGFFLHNRGSERKTQFVLINNAGYAGRAKVQTFPYLIFEEAILGQLAEVNPADVLPRAETDKPSRVLVLRAKLKNIRVDIADLQADLTKGYSKALAAVLRDKEREEEKVAGQLQDELAKAARPAERAWEQLPSLVEQIRKEGDTARLRIRPVLRVIVEEVRVLLVKRGARVIAAVQFFFPGGARRFYAVLHSPACRNRPGYWRCLDLADLTRSGPFDLRCQADARDMESALSAAEIPGE